MYIILSQRKDIESSYSDDLYRIYHFPARYKAQIRNGDIFIYYQGDRYNREHRVYFGTGVVKNVYTTDGESYYAELSDCLSFEKEVPIYLNDGQGYIEQFGYETVRKSPVPPWQSSIRPLSEKAYQYIISHAENLIHVFPKADMDNLKSELKGAIKGFYINGDLNSLKNASIIANRMLSELGIQMSSEMRTLDSEKGSSVQSLIDYCRTMKMSYSYKPVLILSLIHGSNLSVKIDEAVMFFREFYAIRRKNGQRIEKQNCIYQNPNVSDERIADNIVSNPVKALSSSGYFDYLPDQKVFRVTDHIAKLIIDNDVSLIESICKQKLQEYFSSLEN